MSDQYHDPGCPADRRYPRWMDANCICKSEQHTNEAGVSAASPATVGEAQLEAAPATAPTLEEVMPNAREMDSATRHNGVDAVEGAAHPGNTPTLEDRERFDCSECGKGVSADEDGCCVTCGRDCAITPATAPLADGGICSDPKDEGEQ